MNKRLEFVHGIYLEMLKKMVEHKDMVISPKNGEYVHPAFENFYRNNSEMFSAPVDDSVKMEDRMFNYFVDCDPSKRKKYVQWYVTLFKEYQIASKEKNEPKDRANKIGGTMYNFFEDLIKVSDCLERYEYLKLTNTFKVEDKQINRFKDYKEVIDLVQPYMAKEGDSNVHTLDHKEINVLKIDHEATLFADTTKHIVVITHTKEANSEFGKFTTWCTAGTRWGSQMFDSYHKRGPLFVVIKKGFGSKQSIEQNPSNRIQLHFESKSYMDAKDRSISLRNLLNEDLELKDAFRVYFETKYLKTVDITQEIITFLLDLGYTDVLMDILAEVKPKTLNLANFKIDENHLKKIFKLTSVETLELSATDIKVLPDEISQLTNLRELHVRNNDRLEQIPEWINKLTNLEILNISGCNISGTINLTGLTKLRQFIADFNASLTEFPKGLDTCTRLQRINLSYCDIRSVDIPVLLPELEMVDVHENPNLSSISERTLTNSPKLLVLAVVHTSVKNADIESMKSLAKSTNHDLHIVDF